jgi:type IV secretion system protein VirD4
MRDGVLMPRTAGAGAVAVLCGGYAVQQGYPQGWWVVVAGSLLLVAAGLVAWRLVYGVMLSAGLWLTATGLVLFLAVPDTGQAAVLHSAWWLLWAAGLFTLLVTLAAIRHGWTGTQGVVKRQARRSRRNHGVASRWQQFRVASGFALRRKAAVLRPSLAQVSWWRRRRTPLTELGTRLARVGLLGIWSPVEDVTMRIGGPRSGKSGELACRILDAPGAVIATSTRTDLITLTGPIREKAGPLYVFNPSGLGGLESTITFDPLQGCTDPKAATDRASDLMAAVSAPGAGGGDREFWSTQARRALAALLHAAALGGLSMREVLVWIGDVPSASNDVRRLLRKSSEPNFEADAVQFLTTNERTRTSITTTIMAALGWLTDPKAAAAARSTGTGFDVAKLLEERGTVYMLGAEDAQTAPLVTALTGHIAREARRISGNQAGGRLDPPLTLALDEAALICPVPLDQWTADMGGRNITIHVAVQSWAQLKQKYGDAGAASIVNNTATLMIYGGTRDPDDLAAYVTLVGERDEDVRTYDHEQKVSTTSTRRVPVLTAAQIAQLPFGKVVIIRRGMPAAIGRVLMAWKRRDVRGIARAKRRTERRALWAGRLRVARARLTASIAAVALNRMDRRPNRLAVLLDRLRWRRITRRTPAVQDTPRPQLESAPAVTDATGEGSRS